SALHTVMLPLPAVARSAIGTVAEQLVVVHAGETARVEEFHCTVDPLVNPVPVTVTGRSPWPAVAAGAERLPMAGAALMVNVAGEELTPSALHTVMLPLPAVARSAKGTVTVHAVVVQGDGDRTVEFHFTVYPLAKPVPLTVTGRSPWPAVAAGAERLPMAGAALMVNVAGEELTPSALHTVMLPLPAVARSAKGTVTVHAVVV